MREAIKQTLIDHGVTDISGALLDELAALTEAKQEALEQIVQWADSYPPDIFREPDLDAVKALLADHDMLVQMDRMHASWARRLTKGIGNIARSALIEKEQTHD